MAGLVQTRRGWHNASTPLYDWLLYNQLSENPFCLSSKALPLNSISKECEYRFYIRLKINCITVSSKSMVYRTNLNSYKGIYADNFEFLFLLSITIFATFKMLYEAYSNG